MEESRRRQFFEDGYLIIPEAVPRIPGRGNPCPCPPPGFTELQNRAPVAGAEVTDG